MNQLPGYKSIAYVVLFTLLIVCGEIVHTAMTPLLLQAANIAQTNENNEDFIIHVVQPGDTLAAIALQYGVSIDLLLQINNISDPNLIFVGQPLQIPTNVAPTFTPTSTEAPLATATATDTATPMPSASATASQTRTPTSRTPQAPTRTPTPTATFTPLPPPAAAGDDIWGIATQPIELLSPVADAIYHSPLIIHGYSQTFEGVVVIRLRDAQGEILGVRRAQGGASDGFAFFQSYLRFEVNEATAATLELFEVSARDGSEMNKVEVALTLRPGQRVIDLDSPKIGETICPSVKIAGYSNTFEANVNLSILQRDGTIVLAQGNTTGGTLGSFAEFVTELNLSIEQPLPVLVGAYESDAQSGGQIDYIRVPISLYPADGEVCKK